MASIRFTTVLRKAENRCEAMFFPIRVYSRDSRAILLFERSGCEFGRQKKEKATNVTFSFGFPSQELITVVAAAAPAISATTAAALSTATTISATAAAAISTTTATTLTWLTGPGLVDDHRAPFVLFSVHPFNGFLGFLVSAHFDKREALRPPCHPVAYDFRAIHFPELREQLL
jgi:hypothetical protein